MNIRTQLVVLVVTFSFIVISVFMICDAEIFCPYAEDGMYHDGKRARFFSGESDGDSDLEEALLPFEKNDYSFEDLCGEVDIFEDNVTTSQTENESWGLLSGRILARVFHFLKCDIKSLLSSAATCKHWNSVVNFYKIICRHVDLSSAGPKCTDAVFQSIMVG